MAADQRTLVSLIVTTWNRPELLRKFFENLQQNTHYPYELVVHDDGSRPEARNVVMSMYQLGRVSTVILNQPDHNQGHGKAVNRAVAASSGEYIVKLNGDECFADGWLTKAVETMGKWGDKIGVLHLAYYYKRAKRDDPITALEWDFGPYTLFCADGLRVVWVGPGCGFMFSRKTWERVGPWISVFCPAFSEDWDWRARVCPMMRLLAVSKSKRLPPPIDLKAHWEQYKDTPWLAAIDPPVVSYHPGHGLCSIGDARKTLRQEPYLVR